MARMKDYDLEVIGSLVASGALIMAFWGSLGYVVWRMVA